jgi:tetratricopeptide (TPR) repeat protein
MRRRLEARGEAEAAAAVAIGLVVDAFPAEPLTVTEPILGGPSDVRSWPTCERFYPHAIALLETLPESDETAYKIGLLCNQIGVYLTARAQFSDAELLCKRALSIYEKVLGPNHLHTCWALNGLRWHYSKVGRHREARLICERVLSIYEKTLVPQDARIGTQLGSLGYSFLEEGNYTKAELCYERALHILEGALGPEDIHVGISLSGLAGVYGAQGRYPEAEPL